MIISVSPSKDQFAKGHHSITIDTMTNEDLTSEVVEVFVDMIVAYGHHRDAVVEALKEVADSETPYPSVLPNAEP